MYEADRKISFPVALTDIVRSGSIGNRFIFTTLDTLKDRGLS